LEESDARLLRAYRGTTWHVRLPGLEASLRPGEHVPPALGLASSAILTAFNPASRLRPPHENRDADLRLLHELEGLRVPVLPVVANGAGHDAHLWSEPGYLVRGLSCSAAVALGGRFGQNAMVWIDGDDRVTLVATRRGFCGCTPGDPLPLG
jgi:hypothetical protein